MNDPGTWWIVLGLLVLFVTVGIINTRGDRNDQQHLDESRREAQRAALSTPAGQAMLRLVANYGESDGSNEAMIEILKAFGQFRVRAANLLHDYAYPSRSDDDYDSLMHARDHITQWALQLADDYEAETILDEGRGENLAILAALTFSSQVPVEAMQLTLRLDRSRREFSPRILESIDPELHERLVTTGRRKKGTAIAELDYARFCFAEKILLGAAGATTN